MALIPSQVLRVAILLSYFSILCHYKALDMPAHQTYGGSWKFLTFIDLVQIHAAFFLLNSSIGPPPVGGGGSRCSARGGGATGLMSGRFRFRRYSGQHVDFAVRCSVTCVPGCCLRPPPVVVDPAPQPLTLTRACSACPAIESLSEPETVMKTTNTSKIQLASIYMI